MTEQEVQQAYMAAKYKAAELIPSAKIQRLVEGRENDPFRLVRLQISRGELTTGNPLKDFIAVEYGGDTPHSLLGYYSVLLSAAGTSVGDFAAVVYYMNGRKPEGGDKPRISVTLGNINNLPNIHLHPDEVDQILDENGELFDVSAGIGLPVEYQTSLFFYDGKAKRGQRKLSVGGELNIAPVNSVHTSQYEMQAPVPSRHFDQDLLIGNEVVEQWFSDMKAQKQYREAMSQFPLFQPWRERLRSSKILRINRK